MADTTLLLQNFGAVLDGVTDDTTALESAISSLDNVLNDGTKRYKITSRNGKIKLSRPIYITKSNVELDLSNSEIIWVGDSVVQVGRERDVAIITVKGEEVTSTKQNITNLQKYNTPSIPTKNVMRLQVTDKSVYQVGDYVNLTYKTGVNTLNTYYPQADILCRIVNIDDYFIYVDYYSPFDYTVLTATGTITKIIPVKNVTIKNMKINDTLPWKHDDTSGDGINRSQCVSGISFWMAVYCQAENIEGTNTKLPLIFTNYAYDLNLKNIRLYDPAYLGSGEGYGVHANQSMYVHCENLYALNERHVLDFSASAFCTAKNIYSPHPKQTSITIHGICEHDIVFENVNGSFNAGSGIENFPCLNMNITLRNYSGIVGTNYCTNLLIDGNSNVKLNNFRPYNCVIANSNVSLRRGIAIASQRRGRVVEHAKDLSYITFNNCTITSTRDGMEGSDAIIEGFDELNINGGRYYDEVVGDRYTQNILITKDIKIVNIKLDTSYDLCIKPEYTNTDPTNLFKAIINLVVNTMKTMKLKASTSVLDIGDGVNNVDLVVNINNITYENSADVLKRFLRVVNSNGFPNSKIVINMNNLDLYSSNAIEIYCNKYSNVEYNIGSNNRFKNVKDIGDKVIVLPATNTALVYTAASNWTAKSGTLNNYESDGKKVVIHINAEGGTMSNGTTIANIPAPYRPQSLCAFPASWFSSTGSGSGLLNIYPSGNIQLVGIQGNTQLVSVIEYSIN